MRALPLQASKAWGWMSFSDVFQKNRFDAKALTNSVESVVEGGILARN